MRIAYLVCLAFVTISTIGCVATDVVGGLSTALSVLDVLKSAGVL